MWSGQYTILIVFPGRPHYLSPISCSNLKTFLPIFKHLESNSCILVNWPALYLFGLVDERDSSVRNERILSFFIFPFFRDFRFFFRFFGFGFWFQDLTSFLTNLRSYILFYAARVRFNFQYFLSISLYFITSLLSFYIFLFELFRKPKYLSLPRA